MMIIMKKKVPSPKHQVLAALKVQMRIGESKHQAKLDRLPGQRAPEGIFNWKTHDSYLKHGTEFLIWARETHGEKWLLGAGEYADEWLQTHVDDGCHSAYTLHLERSAIRKVYQDQDLASLVKLPLRRKIHIKRSRGVKPSDVNFSERKNQGLVDFCKGTGLRRMELKALLVEQIQVQEDGTVVLIKIKGKGGRIRNVPVIYGYEKTVLEAASAAVACGQIKVWASVPVHMDVHSYRRYYTQSLYALKNGGLAYVKYHPNHLALIKSSHAAGHGREDVLINNYFD
jgi:hypothetical protein